MHSPYRPAVRVLVLGLCLASAGCASLGPEPVRSRAHALAAPAIGRAASIDVDAHREHLLTAPLSVDAAVALALAHSPELKIAWSRLDIGAAEVFEAQRLANPQFSFARSRGDEGRQYTRGVGLNLAGLLLLPQQSRLARRDFEALEIEVAARLVHVARDVEAAWYQHVAALQTAQLAEAVAEAAEASAELAMRFHSAGNISRLQLVRERANAGEARIEAARARASAISHRARLNALIGLDGAEAANWRAFDTLPLPAGEEPALDELLIGSHSERLELRAAELQIGVLGDGSRLARRWRWLGGFELDYEWEREPDGARMRGPGLSLELPLFQQGQASVLRSQARLARGEAEYRERRLAVERDLRMAHAELLAQRAIVDTYARIVVPDRAEVVARELERYNFMLIGAFELLDARRDEFKAYAAWIESVRDYWLARTELAHASGRPLPPERDGTRTQALESIIRPGGTGHSGHHGHGTHTGHAGHEAHSDHAAHREHSGHAGHPPQHAHSEGKGEGESEAQDSHSHHEATDRREAPTPRTQHDTQVDPHAHHEHRTPRQNPPKRSTNDAHQAHDPHRHHRQGGDQDRTQGDRP